MLTIVYEGETLYITHAKQSHINIDAFIEIEAENKRLKKAWKPLRKVLAKYYYNVGGKPSVVKEAIDRFEQALKEK